MVRDLPGHMAMKERSKKAFDKGELKQKLEAIGGPSLSLKEVEEFADVDADYSDDEMKKKLIEGDDLLKELARIKKERAIEEARKFRQVQDQVESKFTSTDQGYSMKLKWTEETVFRNQAVEPERKRDAFVNDPIRNEYHRKFLQKYLHT